jgi:hypothetical protein
MVGGEATTAWKAVNFIYGDEISTNPSISTNSWANYNGVGNAPIANTNQLVQNSILNNNNKKAASVNPANRDNLFPLAIPVAYALAGTILTNEALKQQGEGDAGVGAHRVANQVKEGVATFYEGVKSVDPHLRQSIENVEDAASFVVSKTISGSDVAVSSLFDTNSNQPVTETLAQVNQWYDNLPESQKGSVDLAGVLTSVVGSQYLGAAARNIDVNKPDIDLGGVGNNSPGTEIVPYYPSNDGFFGNPTTVTLMPGTKIDRYGDIKGEEYGRFLSPINTPAVMRSLPGNVDTNLYQSYEVLKPFDIKSGTASPAFGQPGLGSQYLSPVQVKTLIKRNIIKSTNE